VDKIYDFPASIFVHIDALTGASSFQIDEPGWYTIFAEPKDLTEEDENNLEYYVLISKSPLSGYQNPSNKISGIYIPYGEICTLWLDSGIYYAYLSYKYFPTNLMIYQHNNNPFKMSNNNTIKRELQSLHDHLSNIDNYLDALQIQKTFGWFYWQYDYTIQGNVPTNTFIKINDIMNGIIGTINKTWQKPLPYNYYVEIYQIMSRISGYTGSTNYTHVLGIHVNNIDIAYIDLLTVIGRTNPLTASTQLLNAVQDSTSSPKSAIPLIADKNMYIVHEFLNGNGTTDVSARIQMAGVVKYV